MNKAIFLDRDGVLNLDFRNYHFRTDDFTILPHVFEVLKEFADRGYLLIVVSNQGGIGKGLYKIEDTEQLHNHLKEEAAQHHVHFTEIYYCTHHPETSKCICRKPESVLVEKAIARFDIDASKSYFIGDRDRDIEAGEKCGVKGILIEANSSLKDYMHLVA